MLQGDKARQPDEVLHAPPACTHEQNKYACYTYSLYMFVYVLGGYTWTDERTDR